MADSGEGDFGTRGRDDEAAPPLGISSCGGRSITLIRCSREGERDEECDHSRALSTALGDRLRESALGSSALRAPSSDLKTPDGAAVDATASSSLGTSLVQRRLDPADVSTSGQST